MRWIPTWLGNAYCRLWDVLGSHSVFTTLEAEQILDTDSAKARMLLARLQREGYVIKVGSQSRRRNYRLLSPEIIINAINHNLYPSLLKSGLYRFLVFSWLLVALDTLTTNLVSVVVFGSVATGKTTPESDIDMLIVAEDIGITMDERIETLCGLENNPLFQEEMNYLWQTGIRPKLDYIPLDKGQVSHFRPIFLDVATDGVLIFDREHFLEKQLAIWRINILELGAERRFDDKNYPYWVLTENPSSKEVFST